MHTCRLFVCEVATDDKNLIMVGSDGGGGGDNISYHGSCCKDSITEGGTDVGSSIDSYRYGNKCVSISVSITTCRCY